MHFFTIRADVELNWICDIAECIDVPNLRTEVVQIGCFSKEEIMFAGTP